MARPFIRGSKVSTSEQSDSEVTECQFHKHCGGWCELRREREHRLCKHCLETYDQDMALPGTVIQAEPSVTDWEEVRQNADRYVWLREHAVRIQGSQMWYQGAALDIRVDVGRERMANQAKQVQEGGMLVIRHQPE